MHDGCCVFCERLGWEWSIQGGELNGEVWVDLYMRKELEMVLFTQPSNSPSQHFVFIIRPLTGADKSDLSNAFSPSAIARKGPARNKISIVIIPFPTNYIFNKHPFHTLEVQERIKYVYAGMYCTMHSLKNQIHSPELLNNNF